MPNFFSNTVSPVFLGRAALYSATTVLATGCSSQTAALATGIGLGVAAASAIAWTAYRRLTRLGETETRSPPPAARLQIATSKPRDTSEVEDVKKRLRLTYPILSEGIYATILDALAHRSVEKRKAAGKDETLQPFLDAQIDELRIALREAPRKDTLRRLLDALEPRTTSTPTLAPPPSKKPTPPAERFPVVSVQDVIALEPYLIGEETSSPEAGAALTAFCEKALGHERQAVAITAEFLAKRLFDERLSPALKPESDLFTGIDAVTVLKTLALSASAASVSERAVEILAMEAIFHGDQEIVMLVVRALAEIADKNHARFAATALISLRHRGFLPQAPVELTVAVIDTLALIAAPVSSPPSEDATASRQALQILIWDGLSRLEENEAVVAAARRAITAAWGRRPEIFSEDLKASLEI